MGKISLEIVSDISNLLNGTDMGVDGLKTLSTEAAKTKAVVTDSFDSSSKASRNFNSAVDATVKKLNDEGKVHEALIARYGNARAALLALQKELGTMASLGQRNTKEFKELAAVTAQFKNEIGEANAEIKKMSSNTATFDKIAEGARGMTAAFEFGAGATALFGEKNEDLEKSIQKTQGAMSLAMGIQELARLATEKGGIVTGFATAAQGAYATVLGLVSGELTVATVAQKAFSAAVAFSPIGAILLTLTAVVALYKVYSDRQAFAKQEFEDYVKQVEAGEDLIKAALERSNQERQTAIALLQAQKASAVDIHEAEVNSIQNEIAANRQLIASKNELEVILRKRFNEATADSEEEKALEKQIDDNQKAKDALILQQQVLFDKLTVGDAAFKQKQIENERAYQQALFDLKQRAAKEAEIFQNGEQRIRTEERISLAAIAQLRKQIELQNVEQGRAAQLTLTQEDQLRILKDVIFRKAADDRLNLFRKQEEDSLKLLDDGRQKEIESAELTTTKLLDNLELSIAERKRITEQGEKQIADINAKYNLSNLNANEAHQLSLINQLKRGGLPTIEFEKLKSEKKLAVIREFGLNEIALLESQIPAATAEEKKKISAQIDAIKEKIAAAEADFESKANAPKKFSISKLIFGDLTDANGNSLNEAADQAIQQAISSALKVASDAVDMEIALNQKVIDSLNQKVSAEESLLSKEQELQKKGMANNVATEKKRLDALHQQQKDALEQAKKLAKEKQAIDAITQTVSLITASAQIYSNLASAGPAGVAIAAVTIAAMFAAFLAAQIKAGELVNNQGFREGGYTGDGDPSETSTAVGKRPYKYHKKEFVMNEGLTTEYRDFFEALHRDDKPGILFGIADLLAGTGVVMPDENLPNKLFTAKETSDRITSHENNSELRELKKELVEIKQELKEWRKEPREETTSHGDNLIVKKGNRTIIKSKAK